MLRRLPTVPTSSLLASVLRLMAPVSSPMAWPRLSRVARRSRTAPVSSRSRAADELAKTGKEAQLGYAKNVALLEAAQQAGLEGAGIPFGPAEGTDVVTTAAYKMYLSGIAADTENNALKYGLGVLLIAGAGGAAFAAARKVTG